MGVRQHGPGPRTAAGATRGGCSRQAALSHTNPSTDNGEVSGIGWVTLAAGVRASRCHSRALPALRTSQRSVTHARASTWRGRVLVIKAGVQVHAQHVCT